MLSMTAKTNYLIRRTHRYLGVLLGIQFLFWTIGGLYFSWSNMDEIHGDFQKKPLPLLLRASQGQDIVFVSPSIALKNLKTKVDIDSILTIALIDVLGKPSLCMADTIKCINSLMLKRVLCATPSV